MHPDTLHMPLHMRRFGLHVVGQSLEHATFAAMGNPYLHAIAAVQAAHGSEIIIKARIAQEHPLLIFSSLPKPPPNEVRLMDAGDLLARGKTATYFELPDLLWATTGYRIPELDRYIEFGKSRNMLQHLACPPNQDLSSETLRYAFTVIEPMIADFWGESLFSYVGLLGEETEVYLKEQLDRLGISYEVGDDDVP